LYLEPSSPQGTRVRSEFGAGAGVGAGAGGRNGDKIGENGPDSEEKGKKMTFTYIKLDGDSGLGLGSGSVRGSDNNGNGNGGQSVVFGEKKINKEGDQQLYHAYYAPADHKPPPGYVRLSVDEFNELFKDADIQYVPNSEKEGGKSSASSPSPLSLPSLPSSSSDASSPSKDQ
jgi:hypothetical protein